jgi:hypothetical protein
MKMNTTYATTIAEYVDALCCAFEFSFDEKTYFSLSELPYSVSSTRQEELVLSINHSSALLNRSIPDAFFLRHTHQVNWAIAGRYSDRFHPSFWESVADQLTNDGWLSLCQHNTTLPVSFWERHIEHVGHYIAYNESLPVSFWEEHIDTFTHHAHILLHNESIPPRLLKRFVQSQTVSTLSRSVYPLPVQFWNDHIDTIHWFTLCSRQILPLTFWETHVDKLDWFSLSYNPSIPETFWRQHIMSAPVNWFSLADNPILSSSFWHDYAHLAKWPELCKNKFLPVQFWEDHLDRVCWRVLCKNPSVPVDFWERHYDEIIWESLVDNPSIPTSLLESFMETFPDDSLLSHKSFLPLVLQKQLVQSLYLS